jgi:hypothetical protein
MTFFKTGAILRPPIHADTKTIVVFGTERGGTSPIAGIVRGLGVYMGDNLEGNNEDPLFMHKPVSRLKEVIRLRNSSHAVWGWKFPKAAQQLPLYLKSLRNPHLIIVSRDPVAIALGNQRWNGPEMAKNFRFALNEAAVYNMQNIGLALAANVPTLLVSYEKFRGNFEDTIDMVASFLDIIKPEGELRSRLVQYVSAPGYKKFEKFFRTKESPGSSHTDDAHENEAESSVEEVKAPEPGQTA